MLQCALRQGLKLEKIHRILGFHQSTWLKPYIKLNTNLRKQATDEFAKNFYKLLCNAIYGKTMENVRSRSEIYLRGSFEGRYGVKKLMAVPNFNRVTIFNENLVAVHLNKTHVKMDKPICIGMSILELSKVLMYDFHYDKMKKKYKDKIELMYTGILCSAFTLFLSHPIHRHGQFYI